MTESTLTPQEQVFLDALFSTNGIMHPDEAKQVAGYPKDYSVLKIVTKIRKELINRCDDYLTLYAPHGIKGLMDVMTNPMEPGAKVKLQAVVELLDRSGITKKDKSETQEMATNFLFVLPSKVNLDG